MGHEPSGNYTVLKRRVSSEKNLYSVKSKKQESRSIERNDIGENTCDVERSEPVPPERWCHTSGFIPRAPLARTLGAEESLYMNICVHI